MKFFLPKSQTKISRNEVTKEEGKRRREGKGGREEEGEGGRRRKVISFPNKSEGGGREEEGEGGERGKRGRVRGKERERGRKKERETEGKEIKGELGSVQTWDVLISSRNWE